MKNFKLFTVMLLFIIFTSNTSKASTLCEGYGGIYFYFTVGSGTSYPKVSDLIPSSNTINFPIYIAGDFEIDKNCTFLNNIVKIAPGVRITVKGGSYYNFTLDNAKLFACGGLWEGIFVDYSAIITTTNNTQIEDAERAIFTDQNAYMSINNTTFNRNDIGIDITTTYGIPILSMSTNVKFTCTSPLNGTISDISFAGIQTNNFNLSIGSIAGSPIIFDGLENGIYNETSTNPTSLIGRNLEVKNIEYDGIYLEYGTLDLDGCEFTNNLLRSVSVKVVKKVTVINTDIIYDSGLLVPNSLTFRYGFYLDGFAGKAIVDFENINLDADLSLSDDENVILGIYLKGGSVGADTEITILNSDFNGHSVGGGGIIVDGAFPSDSQIDIFNNYFTDCNAGIFCVDGNQNNVTIHDNEFAGNFIGIMARGSSGIGNEINSNVFNPIVGFLSVNDVQINNYQNLIICSNRHNNASQTAYFFISLNTGTDFLSNEIYGTEFGVDIYLTSLMGLQTHKGNRWYDTAGGIRSTWHARCQTTSGWPSFSKFTVHTPQTIWNGSSYTYFSEYHRENISPNISSFFEIDLSGTPSEGCETTEMATSGNTDELDLLIANNQIPIPQDKPAYEWMLKDFLYKKLKRIPTAHSENSSFSAFLANESNSSLEKLYNVSKIIEAAQTAYPEALAQMEQLQLNETSVIQQVVELNELIVNTKEVDDLEVYLKTRENLLERLYVLQLEYQKWYNRYKDAIKEKYETARAQNKLINDNTLAVNNEKEVNDIFLTVFIEQDGNFNEEQIERLKKVALQCPDEGGMAVYNARGLLPTELKLELWNEFPCSRNWLIPFTAEIQRTEQISLELKNEVEVATPLLYPNPSNSSFVIANPEDKKGLIMITDLTGQVVQKKYLNGQNNFEVVHNLPNGIYLVSLRFDDGGIITEKLVVQKNK